MICIQYVHDDGYVVHDAVYADKQHCVYGDWYCVFDDEQYCVYDIGYDDVHDDVYDVYDDIYCVFDDAKHVCMILGMMIML